MEAIKSYWKLITTNRIQTRHLQIQRKLVQIKDGTLLIDDDTFKQTLKDKNITGEYVYIYFDGIMKVPGSGGGGNTARVSTNDFSDITYLALDCIENDILNVFLKYIL